jgi:hypothetical protein
MVMPENGGQPEVIHIFVEPFQAADGRLYDVRVLGRERSDGTWIAWLEFIDPLGAVLPTDRETTQSSGEQVKYWAEGLELTYLEGAFDRARRS